MRYSATCSLAAALFALIFGFWSASLRWEWMRWECLPILQYILWITGSLIQALLSSGVPNVYALLNVIKCFQVRCGSALFTSVCLLLFLFVVFWSSDLVFFFYCSIVALVGWTVRLHAHHMHWLLAKILIWLDEFNLKNLIVSSVILNQLCLR